MEVQLFCYDAVNDLKSLLVLMAVRMGLEPTRDRAIPTRVATGADTRFRRTSPRPDEWLEEWRNGGMDGGPGFEPGCREPKARVLPLNDPPPGATEWLGRRDSNPRKPDPESGAVAAGPRPYRVVDRCVGTEASGATSPCPWTLRAFGGVLAALEGRSGKPYAAEIKRLA